MSLQAEEIFKKIKNELGSSLEFLKDKPAETLDSTLKACWLTAAGIRVSAKKAANHSLPPLTESQLAYFHSLLRKRIHKIPLAHITGRQNFMKIELLVDERALIPRKETEILATEALLVSKWLSQNRKPVRILDICCGSGNLALTLAHYNSHAKILATDLSAEAVELTKENISLLNLYKQVQVFTGDLFEAFYTDKHYNKSDLIVCNPPYVSEGKVSAMNEEISNHEPELAFNGGQFGLEILQRLVNEAPKFLNKNGYLMFEVGVGQGSFMAELCKRTGKYKKIRSVKDCDGNIRVIVTQKK